MTRTWNKIARSCVTAGTLWLLAAEPVSAQQSMVIAPPEASSTATHVSDAALRFGIPEHWIYAVMRAESAGRVNATSPVGAQGLMQIMPATWAVLRTRYGLGSNAYDPRDNIMAGAAYIREMYEQFGAPGFLGAYNAGPGRYGDYVTKGRTLPSETRAYIAKIAPEIAGTLQGSGRLAVTSTASPAPGKWTHAALFAVRPARPDSAEIGAAQFPSNGQPYAHHTRENIGHNSLFVQISGRNSE
jgi:hypothetical protein